MEVHMSQNTDNVRQWRRKLKQRIVDSMGGKCVCCGYDKCLSCLTMHHLDPSQKDFTFGKIRTSPKKWEIIVKELRKCVLICNRCHTELHEGIRKVPHNAPRFNEAYAVQKEIKDEKESCLFCGTSKSYKKKTHLIERGGKSKKRANRDEINLRELLNRTGHNYSVVAKILGMSHSEVRKRARKLGIL